MIMSIGFIGAGNMASAIIETVYNTGYIKPENIYIYDTDREKIDRFAKCGMIPCGSAAEVFERAGYVFLCIKPQVFRQNSAEYKGLAK